jgi:uncharacterized protein (DUF3820 family)
MFGNEFMPWGKYRGWPLLEVPSSYLCWVCSGDCFSPPSDN